MLVLSRKAGEQLVIGTNIIVTLTEIGAGKVKIGIQAPKDVPILRGELAEDPDAVAFHHHWAETERTPPLRTDAPKEAAR